MRKSLIKIIFLSSRDGYRGMATFPAQNRECLCCARPKACTQPSLPCSGSTVSMSQGRWMKKPRSEYTRVPWTCLCQHRPSGTLAFIDVHVNAFAPLIHLKCRRKENYQYFNGLAKDRKCCSHHLALNDLRRRFLMLFPLFSFCMMMQ